MFNCHRRIEIVSGVETSPLGGNVGIDVEKNVMILVRTGKGEVRFLTITEG